MADLEDMSCFQCEQTVKPSGCHTMGVCSKNPRIAALQDLIIYGAPLSDAPIAKIAFWMFTTLTNVNFDEQKHLNMLTEMALSITDTDFQRIFAGVQNDQYAAIRARYSPDACLKRYGADIGGLRQFGIQGAKGAFAYGDHALRLAGVLQIEDSPLLDALEAVKRILNCFCHETATIQQLLEQNLALGAQNLIITQKLDDFSRKMLGNPKLSSAKNTYRPGKCILVSGHDLADLKSLIEQCEGKGIDVYTHGEMLPAHAYPAFSGRLAGNFGTAWYRQQTEFALFPGPILLTSNCIMEPRRAYIERIYGSGPVAYEGIRTLENDKWDDLIAHALKCEGFVSQEQCDAAFAQMNTLPELTGLGFNHTQFEELKPAILEKIKSGAIKGFRFVGGCDGADRGRSVFTRAGMECPDDKIILTGGCGRFRVNNTEHGTIEGVPRLLDVGQCSDVYSAILILVSLAKALDAASVNALPIEFFVSWYEQKANIQLLTLLSLGVQNIKLGPTAPVALSQNVAGIFAERYGVSFVRD
ncbi:Hybrid cluster protein 2 [Spironucleus salmonicida]|uniref:Hybrid cluster protein 2 n=2 Tax=Spironucleus TaxID=39709 RepID=K7R8P0_9EUKA|nr:hybrid cluster protein 2 [Spironucleus salmonicida]KAH0575860.1 Hybrid cluster protein 2 [Spironucleus salmonicida]|eukprot:EST44235.1 Hybrid cluster protein 2 [Spironucleus salmonicida]